MKKHLGAAELLRSMGLIVDGPALWGSPVRSRAPGVYVVELPAPMPEPPVDLAAVRGWIERVPTLLVDGERPTAHQLAARLGAFWLPDQSVVYVGRSTAAVGRRVEAFYHTPLGDRRPHAGGHWLKTLRVLDRLRIWWAETDAAEEYEDGLLSAFAAQVDPEVAARLHDPTLVLPFANLATATGERKAHGITGSVLRDEEERSTVQQVGSSDRGRSAGAASPRPPAASSSDSAARSGPAPVSATAARSGPGTGSRAAARPSTAPRPTGPAARSASRSTGATPSTPVRGRQTRPRQGGPTKPPPSPTYLSAGGLEQLRAELARQEKDLAVRVGQQRQGEQTERSS